MSNPLAAPHLQKTHELLSEAFKELDQACGALPSVEHGAALDARDSIGRVLRQVRVLRLFCGTPAGELGP